MPQVSVVIAARNAARHLSEAIASVQAQTFSDLELIVVDDASEDRTPDLVERHASADGRVRLVRRDEPGGPYAAAMSGIADAQGRYLARIDADDVAPANRLAHQVAQLESTGAGASTGAWRTMSANGIASHRIRRVSSRSNRVLAWRLGLESGLAHGTMMIELALFHELGGYRPRRVAEDYRLWSKLTQRGALSVTDEVLLHYRLHPEQIVAAPGASTDRLRIENRQEHLREMTGGDWTEAEVVGLRRVGTPMQQRREVGVGIRALERWSRSWRADPAASASDRAELHAGERLLALRHLRWNPTRSTPPTVMRALATSLRPPGRP